jgi:hypothetical protein
VHHQLRKPAGAINLGSGFSGWHKRSNRYRQSNPSTCNRGHITASFSCSCSALSRYGDVTIAGDLTHATNPDPGAWHGHGHECVGFYRSIVRFFFCFFAELAAMCCVMPARSETPRTVQLLPQLITITH